jgi:uncharacterized protein
MESPCIDPRSTTRPLCSIPPAFPALLLLISGCGRDHLVLPRNAINLPADGRTHIVADITRHSDRSLTPDSIEATSSELRFEQRNSDSLIVVLRSPVMPGTASPHFAWREHRYTLTIHYFPIAADSFHDGLPDALRLHSAEDRQAFRSWFAAIAEQEASLPGDKLPPELDDCAALLRYAYRESMVQHDDRWFAAQPEPARFASLVSIAQYHYPDTPLGLNLFRVAPGPYTPADPSNGSFTQFADAHALLAFNAYPVGRNVRAAIPGDLLFFRQLEQNSQYHSMVITGPKADWVIYHTGPIGKQKGEIRRVTIEDLLHHPDARWRPVPANTNFLGVYRWNVLHDGD